MERLSPEEYVKLGWKLHKEYVDGVESGEIITNEWIKLAVKRYKEDLQRDDIELKENAVNRILKFISIINIEKDKQFPLLPFQAFILVNLFGLYYKNTNRRKYNYAFLFISRKNGKTEFAALLQLYFLLADGVEAPENLLLASTTKQAKIALNSIQRMIMNTDILKKYLQFPKRGYDIFFKNPDNVGYISVFVPSADKLDGYSPTSSILDEIHAYTDSALFDIISQGVLARENPLIFLTSTAGFNKESFCNDLVEGGKNILLKNYEDDSFFYMLYMPDENDDPTDENCWIKSNPALGKINNLEHLRNNFKKARLSPSSYNSFLTKNLNIFTQSHAEWIEQKTLNEAINNVDYSELYGQECYAGIDLSSTQDLTSFVLLFKVNDRFKVIPYFFLADNKMTRNSKFAYKYEQWERDDHLIRCNSQTIDYDLIADKIKELKELYVINYIGYDPYNIELIERQLKELGFTRNNDYNNQNLIPVKQTHGALNAPMKYVESLLINKYVDFTDNPILPWNITNAMVQQERTYGNIKPVKNANRDPIDGLISLLNAMSVYLKFNDDESGDLLEVWKSYMNLTN